MCIRDRDTQYRQGDHTNYWADPEHVQHEMTVKDVHKHVDTLIRAIPPKKISPKAVAYLRSAMHKKNGLTIHNVVEGMIDDLEAGNTHPDFNQIFPEIAKLEFYCFITPVAKLLPLVTPS